MSTQKKKKLKPAAKRPARDSGEVARRAIEILHGEPEALKRVCAIDLEEHDIQHSTLAENLSEQIGWAAFRMFEGQDPDVVASAFVAAVRAHRVASRTRKAG